MNDSAIKKVLLTGGFGLVGQSTLTELLSQGFAVRVLELPSRRGRRIARRFADVQVVWGDIRDAAAVAKAVEDCDAVIHQAAVLPPVTDRHPALGEAVNVDGTRHLLDAMAQSERRPGLVYTSSITVHGPPGARTGPVGASDPIAGTDAYSEQKVRCEAMIREASLPWWSIQRVGVVLHPDQRQMDGDTFRLLFSTSLDTRMEYVAPEDVALAQVGVLRRTAARNRVLMVGGGEGCQVYQRDVLTAAFDALGVGMFPDAAFGDAPFYTDWMDTTESQALLGYQRHRFSDYCVGLDHSLRGSRWLSWPVRPLLRRWLLSHSEAWRARSRSGQGGGG